MAVCTVWHSDSIDASYFSHYLFLREIGILMNRHYEIIHNYYVLMTQENTCRTDFVRRVFDDNTFKCWGNIGRKKLALAIFRYVIYRNGCLEFSSVEIADECLTKINLYTDDILESMQKKKNDIIYTTVAFFAGCSLIGTLLYKLNGFH